MPARGCPPPNVGASSERTAARVLLEAFARLGARVAFGIPGGAIGPVFDALAEVPQIELVPTRHEATAVFAAMGHARATGTPGIVLVTAGPGVTNCATGIAAAWLEELPVLVLAGEVSTCHPSRAGFQDGTSAGIDVVGMLRRVTRWSGALLAPEMAAASAERAWLSATEDAPGPVLLSVPFDVARARAASVSFARPPREPRAPDVKTCAAAASRLAAAHRPLLFLGAGARGANAEAVALAERLDLPVVVTGHAKGAFPERHPLYLGLVGNAGHPSALEYVQRGPDVACVVGTRLGEFATNGWQVDPSGSVDTIQIDRDPALVGRNARVTLALVADAAQALRSILEASPPRGRRRAERPALRRVSLPSTSSTDLLQPDEVLVAMADAFPDAIWSVDIGEHMGFAQHYLEIDRPERFHCFSGLASMGSGLGAALGIKQARPGETVIALAGDGGFNMCASEVLTCVEHEIGVIFVVFNDGRWNMVEHGFSTVFQRRPAGLPNRRADLAAVARGYGAVAEVVHRTEQLEPQRLRDVASAGPIVLDVRIDPNASLSAGSRSVGLAEAGMRVVT